MMTQKETLPELEKSCLSCTHMRVCAPFTGIVQMLEAYKTPDSLPPFDAEKLALICREYFSAGVVDRIRNNESYL